MSPAGSSKKPEREGRHPVRGDVLAEARKKKGFSYQVLSDSTFWVDDEGNDRVISVNTIKKAEAGGPCYLSTIVHLAKAVELEPGDLIVTSGETTKPPEFSTMAEAAIVGRHETDKVTLSQQTRSVSATVSLFDSRTMQDDHYDPIEWSLEGEFGWSHTQAHLVIFVLRELVDNGFIHGCRGAGELEVSFFVTVNRDGEEVALTVRSPGEGFDVARVLRESEERGIGDDENPGGRGLIFVKHIAKEFTASSDGRVIQVVMEKNPRRIEQRSLNPTIISANGKNVALITLPRKLDHHLREYIDFDKFDDYTEQANVIGGIFDMRQCDDISSGCYDALNFMIKYFRKKGLRYATAIEPGIVLEVFERTRLTSYLNTMKSMDDCIYYISN